MSNLHAISSVKSDTGYVLHHLEPEKFEELKEQYKVLSAKFKAPNYLFNVDDMISVGKLAKDVIVDIDAFTNLQRNNKINPFCIEILNDMIKTYRGQSTLYLYMRIEQVKSSVHHVPKNLYMTPIDMSELIIKNLRHDRNEFIHRLGYILGELVNES